MRQTRTDAHAAYVLALVVARAEHGLGPQVFTTTSYLPNFRLLAEALAWLSEIAEAKIDAVAAEREPLEQRLVAAASAVMDLARFVERRLPAE